MVSSVQLNEEVETARTSLTVIVTFAVVAVLLFWSVAVNVKTCEPVAEGVPEITPSS
jgi:hypothetical protein